MKIVIADDSSIMRKIIRLNLKKIGIEDITECSNGESAYRVLQANPDTNLLFTDVNMPGINGLDLVNNLRKSKKHASLEIVVISEYLSEKIEKAFTSLRVDSFIPKPFDLACFNYVVTPLIDLFNKENNSQNQATRSLTKERFVELMNLEPATMSLDGDKIGVDIILEKYKINLPIKVLLSHGIIETNIPI